MTGERLDQAIENYGETAKAASTGKVGKLTLAGFGAAAAGGLFTASEADAGIVYSGIINVGFAVSTVNTSTMNTPAHVIFNSTGGAPAFAVLVNNRGPNNPVGSTDIIWAAGAGASTVGGLINVGGIGNVFANGPSFPASIVPQPYSTIVPPGAAPGTPASLAWAAAGNPQTSMSLFFDPFGVGGNNPTGVTNYFAFSFSNGTAGTYFGWARINITSGAGLPTSFTIIDWAYDNMNNPIHVGSIPEPSAAGIMGLCALAAGAAGIRRRRKEKAQAS